MNNSELAAWIASKLPDGYLNKGTLVAGDIPIILSDGDWLHRSLAVTLMLDALTGHGCDYRVEGPDSHGKHLCWVATENPPPDAMSVWDVRRFGDSRYAAARAACEAVAENNSQ